MNLSTAPVPYPTAILQGTQTEPESEELRGNQPERFAHPDLDSPDCHPFAEVVASSLESEMVTVQPGLHAASESIYLPRLTEMDR